MNDIVNELQAVPWPVVAPLIIIQFLLMVIALIDCLRRGGETKGPQWVWIVVIVFGGIFGPIIYFLFGRRND
ncbi:PLD nuclease N-terminal domain-containing protein [Evansella sp. LMS18]|jgi:hypothetical protein|uniref:PLD nuclease N-terminal domain-containing protein n=1 Tax=Evansella sp. LMS18 TaxID=2924033 RepID=UPI0020D18B55|nr:PLD nuclease N-terminal domain-containing protein [Evansella sp. LMS18]UTR11590.1 PLD nuclease N-terminal domain-containing protein [Evansella sp. LMS18]